MYTHNLLKMLSQVTMLLTILGLAACSGDNLTGPGPSTVDTTTTTTGDDTTGGTISSVRIGSIVDNTFTDGIVSVSPNTLSAGGTAAITVNIVDANGDPVTTTTTIDFSSACVSGGLAALSNPTQSTTTGVATTNYLAQGCTGSDIVTATLNGTAQSASGNITVASTTVASIQFSSSTESLIALAGTGSTSGLSENATVKFLVLDNQGLPVQDEDVTFSLSTTVGGISLSTTAATSDGTGEVSTTLQSGATSTSVRVIATVVSNTALTTPSGAIAIATGPPEQNGISISASELNPRAWDVDNKQVTITASLVDRFKNPITDGTAILFTTELGGIEPSCTTIDGACSVIWNSQEPRNNNLAAPGLPGITTILARVAGEEHFNDGDGNGVFSDGDTFVDLPEAFNDENDNGVFDQFEFFDDFDISGTYSTANGLYNGTGCIHSTLCDPASDAITVRKSIRLVMAENEPSILQVRYNNSGIVPLGTTFDTTIDSSITYTIGGFTNGNVLPIGTTIKFTTTNGEIVGSAERIVANTVSTAGTYTVFVGPDGTPSSDGSLAIEIVIGDGGGTFAFTPIPINDGTVNNTRIGAFITGVFTEGVILTNPSNIAVLGTSTLTVDLVDLTGTPITTTESVGFTSPCVVSGDATLSASPITTATGQAVVTYTDVSCTGTDTITATLIGTTNTALGTITISATPPTPGSINQSDITNSTIALAGTGSASGLPETTILTFTIKDSSDNPVEGEAVSFSLNTTVGGITLSTFAAISDANGNVTTIVQSGTVATTVRVTATVDSNTSLTTASSAIAIATGPPDQNSLSVSAETLNPRAWNLDGKEVTITALLGDRYNNPITDGTAISFTTEFGTVSPSCITTDGSCTVTWRSQNPRTNTLGGVPGVTTIMATVEGEESFSDVDGDGVFSDGDSFTDLPEAFRDDNNTAGYDAGEFFVDFDVDGVHDAASGLYNGKGCTHTTDCDSVDAITVRDSIELVLAEDVPVISKVEFGTTTVSYPTGTPTFSTLTDNSISVTIGGADNGQILPVGSTITFGVDSSTIISGGSQIVTNLNAGAGRYTVFLKSDESDPTTGFLTIDVAVGDGGDAFSFTPIAINDVGLTYSIGGTISGLPANTTVTLQNNAGNNLAVNADGTFVFTTRLADGEAYDVTVGLVDPAPATCTVGLGTGTVAGADVTDVVVTCIP